MTEQDGSSITISKADYDALLADRQALAGFRDVLRQVLKALEARPRLGLQVRTRPVVVPGPAGRSAIDGDAELSGFIRPLLWHEKLEQIVALCRDRFGPGRAPSRSAIHRYWMRLRQSQTRFETHFEGT